jgi:hypothetical protein
MPEQWTERLDWGTLDINVDLSQARTFYIRRHINFLGIKRYTGAEKTVYLQYGDSEATRQEILEGAYWQWPFHRTDVRLIITAAQPGKELLITLGGAGSMMFPPVISGSVKLRNAAGTVVNPATEDTVSAIQTEFANRTSFFSKQYTVGTTYTQLDNQAIPDGKGVTLWADKDNSGEIAVGPTSSVAVGTNAGLKGGQGITLYVTNLNKIYVVASAASQKLNVIVEV